MKKIASIFVLSSLLISAASQAMVIPGAMRNVIGCRPEHTVMDVSSSLTLSTNGMGTIVNANLQTNSMGRLVLNENFAVKSLGLNGIVDYVDVQTGGDNFKLKMQGEPLVGKDSKATLKARTTNGDFSEDFICSRLLINF